MATYNPLSAYLESKVLSASPLELVCLTYEEAIEAVRLARTCIIQKRIHDRSRAISKAQLLIAELRKSLDFHRGGQLSEQLAGLYHYMQSRLIEANFKQLEAPLAEVEKLLATILESWRELAWQEKLKSDAATGSSKSCSSSYASPDPSSNSAPGASPWMSPGDSPDYSLADLTL